MTGYKVAIIGAGRMAALLAHRMPGHSRKVIIGQKKASAVALADEVGGLATDQISAVRGADVVFLAVPGSAVAQIVQDATPHLEPDALVVNMAPEVSTVELAETYPKVRFAAAKVLGHAGEMRQGMAGLVLLDHLSPEDEHRLRPLLEGLGQVMRGAEERVLEVHAAVAEVLVRAEADLRGRLETLGFDKEAAHAVLTTMGPGVLRSLAEGEPFMQEAIRAARNTVTDSPH